MWTGCTSAAPVAAVSRLRAWLELLMGCPRNQSGHRSTYLIFPNKLLKEGH
jgi:hypothetical protein